MARSEGWQSQVEREGQQFLLTLTRGDAPAVSVVSRSAVAAAGGGDRPRIVVFVTSNLFGRGDEKLEKILMRSFIKTLKDLDTRPQKVIFANAGVRLTTTGSTLIEDSPCVGARQCVDHLLWDLFGLLRTGRTRIQVGVASNMYEIATSFIEADRIVQP